MALINDESPAPQISDDLTLGRPGIKIDEIPKLTQAESTYLDYIKKRDNVDAKSAYATLKRETGEVAEPSFLEEFLNPVNLGTGLSSVPVRRGIARLTGIGAGKLLPEMTVKSAIREGLADQTLGISEVPGIIKSVKEAGRARKLGQAASEGVEAARKQYRKESLRSPIFGDTPLAESRVAPKPRTTPVAPQPTPAATPPPTIKTFGDLRDDAPWFDRVKYSIKSVFGLRSALAPASLSESAEATAATVRAEAADLALKTLRAQHQFAKSADKFAAMDVAAQRHFIVAFERGLPQGDAELDAVAAALNDVFNSRHAELQRLKLLDTFRQDYFPHLWKDPDKAQSVFANYARRPLAGSEGFRKQRTFDLYEEGLRAGLEPLYENPVTASLAKLREVDKSIMAHRIAEQLKREKLIRFARTAADAPIGWQALPDKMFRVLARPEIRITEAFDQGLMDQLSELARSLGIRASRSATDPRLRKGVWGLSSRSTPEIVTRFGGPESVLAHEIGHQIGRMFPEIDALVKHPLFQADILNLAALRWAGGAPDESFKRYVRSIPERHAVLLEALIHAPDVFRDTAPKLFAEYSRLLGANPRLSGILGIRPTLVLGSGTAKLRAPGLQEMGKWYGPRDVGQILERYLSPGLYHGGPFDPTAGGINHFDLIRTLGNTLNQAQLGFSGFHLTFTALDAAISQIDTGLRRMLLKSPSELAGGAKDVVTGLIPGYGAVSAFFRGNRMMREVFNQGLDPTMDAYVKAMIDAGGRARMDDFYRVGAWKKLKDAWNAPEFKNKIPVAWRWFPAMFEITSYPIMEALVPRMKLGVFMKMAELEATKLRLANPQFTQLDWRKAIGKAWDHVDNRMGQLVYDNLFWNRTVKDLGMIAVRSLGWNLGTVREVGGALAVDVPRALAKLATLQKPEFTAKMGYTTGMLMTIGTYGAVMNYMMTGEPPQSPIDYFAPRTGYTRPDGSVDRLMLPSYIKDLIALRHENILKVIGNKANPWISFVTQFMSNEDFMGAVIANPYDDFEKRQYDRLSFLVEQVLPMGIRSVIQTSQPGGVWENSPLKWGPLVGLVPAPGYIESNEAIEAKKLRPMIRRKFRGEAMRPKTLHKIFGPNPFE